MKSVMETLVKMGSPSMKRKITIRPRVVKEASARQKKRIRIAFSLFCRPLPL
jgi:hypothetical protein